MAKRKIIEINEDLCNGCGECTTGCSEGALQIINGKAKLVRDDFCDGFGDCIGTCPTGALKIVERDAKEFDAEATIDNLRKTQGEDAVNKMLAAQKHHEEKENMANAKTMATPHHGGGCPGLRNFALKKEGEIKAVSSTSGIGIKQAIPSDLEQWPVQLHLVNPLSPFLKDKEMVVMSTCAPLASADVHWRYLRGRSVVVACPKLDNTAPYVQKLQDIFDNQPIPKVIIVRMEVPCCGGLTRIVQQAAALSKNKVIIEEHVVSVRGELIEIKSLS